MPLKKLLPIENKKVETKKKVGKKALFSYFLPLPFAHALILLVDVSPRKTHIFALDLYMVFHIEISIEYFNDIMTEKCTLVTQC